MVPKKYFRRSFGAGFFDPGTKLVPLVPRGVSPHSLTDPCAIAGILPFSFE
jgi:hypothetical protein